MGGKADLLLLGGLFIGEAIRGQGFDGALQGADIQLLPLIRIDQDRILLVLGGILVHLGGDGIPAVLQGEVQLLDG